MARTLLPLGSMDGQAPTLKLTWLPHWAAYVVRCNGRIVGMVRCKVPLPFRVAVEFAA